MMALREGAELVLFFCLKHEAAILAYLGPFFQRVCNLAEFC
jgi:hypothetical protein